MSSESQSVPHGKRLHSQRLMLGLMRGGSGQAVTQSKGGKAALSCPPWIPAFVRITPPLRGSRQDEGASPMSRRWGEHLKRLLCPTAQENREGRRPPTAAACAAIIVESRPVSRVLYRPGTRRRQPSIWGMRRRMPPATYPGTRRRRRLPKESAVPLFGLAPGGVCPAAGIAAGAVRSYRTFSPLPRPRARRCIFCGTFHRLAPSRRYLAPCPVKPGLSSVQSQRPSGRLAHSIA